MKKSLLALAALSAFAGAVSAQSSVTIYGKIDQAFAKNIGGKAKSIDDEAGSRLGFMGTEDLGSGLKAIFGFEHRFTPDTGAANATFWNGYSTVGLVTPYGTVNLGRQYTAAWVVQNAIDPWGGDTVAALRYVAVLPRTSATNAAEAKLGDVRTADSVRYDFSKSGFTFAASIGEGPAGKPDRPYALAFAYAAGPVFAGVGYENMANDNDKLLTIGGTYDFGMAKLALSYSKGSTAKDEDAKAFLIGATIPVGSSAIKVGFGKDKVDFLAGEQDLKKASIGVEHKLSKRTKLYADYTKVGGDLAVGPKTGYDLGIQHSF